MRTSCIEAEKTGLDEERLLLKKETRPLLSCLVIKGKNDDVLNWCKHDIKLCVCFK